MPIIYKTYSFLFLPDSACGYAAFFSDIIIHNIYNINKAFGLTRLVRTDDILYSMQVANEYITEALEHIDKLYLTRLTGCNSTPGQELAKLSSDRRLMHNQM